MRNILLFFFASLSVSLYGRDYSASHVDSIHITFEYLYGYATCRSTANYVYQDNTYKLLYNEESNAKNAPKLTETISQKAVDELLKDCNRHASNDICNYINITSKNYSDYVRTINDSLELENTYPMIGFLICDKHKIKDYILNRETFLSLSCNDILKIIDTHYHFYFNKPVTKIELFSSDGEAITIEPKFYYRGTPWSIFAHGQESYISNNHVMSFLRDARLDHIAIFYEKFCLLIQIADYILHQESPDSCMIYKYWEMLSEESKSEMLKFLKVNDNVLKLYNHLITMTDNDSSLALLQTLCSPQNDNERMLYFHLMNEVAKQADGAFAEMLGEYCLKFFNENTDYVLQYLSMHRNVAELYSSNIGAEFYYHDSSIVEYKQKLSHTVKNRLAKEYLPTFLNAIEQSLEAIKEK